MKNKLTDLNDCLFNELERLSDTKLSGDNLTTEIERSKAITQVANTVVDNARLCLDAQVAISASRHELNFPLLDGPKVIKIKEIGK